MIIGSSQRLNKIDSISFKVDNMDLDEVSSFKYLGIVIKNRSTWQDHVDQMFSKINKKLGVLKRIRYCLPLDARLLFLTALFCHCLTMQMSYGGIEAFHSNVATSIFT